jgi:hypothetical protein
MAEEEGIARITTDHEVKLLMMGGQKPLRRNSPDLPNYSGGWMLRGSVYPNKENMIRE